MTPKGQPRAQGQNTVKTTVDLPEELWRRAKIRAMDDRGDLRSIIIAALEAYLKPRVVRREAK